MAATAADIANLVAEYSAIAALRATLFVNPKPSYSENGRSFSWVEYYNFLSKQLDANLKDQQSANGPIEVIG
jgi:hypothetical protein